MPQRKIIVNLATSADGYIARSDDNLDWLTERPDPPGFYGLAEFERSTDARILGRKTFDQSVKMGARFSARTPHYIFSRRPPPASVPVGVHFVTEPIGAFVERLRAQPGKNIWMMGGGEIIGSFLDEDAIDEFIISVVPTFIGEGIPLLAPRHRRSRCVWSARTLFRMASFSCTTKCCDQKPSPENARPALAESCERGSYCHPKY